MRRDFTTHSMIMDITDKFKIGRLFESSSFRVVFEDGSGGG